MDRIEREKTTEPRYDHGYARNVHSAVFAEVKVDEQIGVIELPGSSVRSLPGVSSTQSTARSQILGSVVMGFPWP